MWVSATSSECGCVRHPVVALGALCMEFSVNISKRAFSQCIQNSLEPCVQDMNGRPAVAVGGSSPAAGLMLAVAVCPFWCRVAHAVSAGTYSFFPQTDLKKVGDFPCGALNRKGNQQIFSFEIGTVADVAALCSEDTGCKAFVTAERDRQGGGYLKNVTQPRTFAVKTDLYLKKNV